VGTRPAIEGGDPVRTSLLPFHRPWITEDDIAAVVASLRSGWLTSGPWNRRLEEALRAYLGRPVLPTSSCTAALSLALHLLDVRPGDEVLVPSFTFAATANVVVHRGGIPVFVDVDARWGVVTAETLEAGRTSRTVGAIVVDYGGHPAPYDEIRAWAEQHGVWILEDAAHALGSRYQQTRVGALGHPTAFSFYATKAITTGEGGALVWPDETGLERARVLALHGLSREAWRRYDAGGTPHYQVLEAGYKMNLPDPLAALGVSQLQREAEARARRAAIARQYREGLKDLPGLRWMEQAPWAETNHHLFVVQLDMGRLRVDRDRFLEALRAEGIQASLHFLPLHQHPFYRPYYERQGSPPLPATEHLGRSVLSLPIFPEMQPRDVEDVIQAMDKLLRYYAR